MNENVYDAGLSSQSIDASCSKTRVYPPMLPKGSPLPQNYQELFERIIKVVDEKRVFTNPLYTLAYGTDASFYRLIPKIVIHVNTEKEVAYILEQCEEMHIAVAFRAAGTSLSGQAITDSVLIVATHNWKKYEILDDAKKIRLQTGVIGGQANRLLAPFGRKIGPDPATVEVAMVGGIAANNASGMCCGTSENSYKTIDDIRIIFYDGTLLDTSSEKSREEFSKIHPEIIKGIEDIRDDIKANGELFDLIKRKFKIKNTTGYSLNAFVDFEDPFEIIKHIMIGSEGTLAFISDLTYKTVVDGKYKVCALVFFPTIEDACNATIALKTTRVSAVELLDRESLRSIQDDPETPSYFKSFGEDVCALLIECQGDTKEIIEEKEAEVRKSIENIPVVQPYKFTGEPKEYKFNWKARKGLLPTVGGLRKIGKTVLIEDVAFPIEKLAQGTLALKELFKKYEYSDAVLFGHALEGNLHFVFSQDFSDANEVKRYEMMMNDLAEIIVDRFDGSLKAEHGTGRNMAPFVEKEWGSEAYNMMKRIKGVFDPNGIINPGVILNTDPMIHLKNLKPLPATNPIVDKCMECGFCESSCVSHGLTLSPRHRIVIAREISRLEDTKEDIQRLEQMKEDAQYAVYQTCAADSMCAIACPLRIDTGKFVKEWRIEQLTPNGKKIAEYLSERVAGVSSFARVGLHTVSFLQSILGDSIFGGIANGFRKISGGAIPKWSPCLPSGAKKITNTLVNLEGERKVVYFPSCVNRTMGKSKLYKNDDMLLTEVVEKLLQRAGYTIIYPKNINSLCCGMAFGSKGFKEQAMKKSRELESALFEASEGGTYPVLFDMSPCYLTSMDMFTMNLKVYEPIEFALQYVMPYLKVKEKKEIISVFPVCTVKKAGLTDRLVELTKMCAKNVSLVDTNCCGFAGDRGFFRPEINEHGQRDLSCQIPKGCTDGYSTSRTCEIGMEEYGGINFKSVFYLIEEVTK